ncbi:hypothetical protein BJ508DRAFT_362805 [Ascobolus immersus RN42]|uniref:Protein kinase domain-containing protein n=1 Tax=Ascobolus immersus RN42 TaxID=1160509 RepID=A0A3N4IEC8_ASCIM|nr:hypothetical protein BJ508DRAFT_362805 [Ascobolus immersus RN42]
MATSYQDGAFSIHDYSDPALAEIWWEWPDGQYEKVVKIFQPMSDYNAEVDPDRSRPAIGPYKGDKEVQYFEESGLCPIYPRDIITSSDANSFVAFERMHSSKRATMWAVRRWNQEKKEIEAWEPLVLKIRGSKTARQDEFAVIRRLLEYPKDEITYEEEGAEFVAHMDKESVKNGRAFLDVPLEIFDLDSVNGTHVATVGEWYPMDFKDEGWRGGFLSWFVDWQNNEYDYEFLKTAEHGLRCIHDSEWPISVMEHLDTYKPDIIAEETRRVDGGPLNATLPRYSACNYRWSGKLKEFMVNAIHGRSTEEEIFQTKNMYCIVRLVGLGNSHFVGQGGPRSADCKPPRWTPAPEVLGGGLANSSTAADVWSLGCTIIRMITHIDLVSYINIHNTTSSSNYATADYILATEKAIDEVLLGTPIPCVLHGKTAGVLMRLRQQLASELKDEDIIALAHLLRSMVRVKPEERISIREVEEALSNIVSRALGDRVDL